MRVGIIGCGNIAKIIVKSAEKFGVKVIALYDRDLKKAEKLSKVAKCKYYEKFEDFIVQNFDICIEAASQEAVREYAESVLEHGKDLIILSVGALMDNNLREKIYKKAKLLNKNIYIPSGALFGIDGIKSASAANINRILLRTTKNPKSLGIDIKGREVLFRGRASEAVKLYPFNINVAATLSISSNKDIEVEILADSSISSNVHEIFVEGDFGKAYLRIENIPSKENPKTSYLAALSVLSLLKNLKNPFKIGV